MPRSASAARARNPHIEHNLFDGWGVTRRAIHFNLLLPPDREKPLAAKRIGNVFARYRSAPIVDGAKQIGTIAEAASNVFVEVPESLYETAISRKLHPAIGC